jgi:hypothetical protein
MAVLTVAVAKPAAIAATITADAKKRLRRNRDAAAQSATAVTMLIESTGSCVAVK